MSESSDRGTCLHPHRCRHHLSISSCRPLRRTLKLARHRMTRRLRVATESSRQLGYPPRQRSLPASLSMRRVYALEQPMNSLHLCQAKMSCRLGDDRPRHDLVLPLYRETPGSTLSRRRSSRRAGGSSRRVLHLQRRGQRCPPPDAARNPSHRPKSWTSQRLVRPARRSSWPPSRAISARILRAVLEVVLAGRPLAKYSRANRPTQGPDKRRPGPSNARYLERATAESKTTVAVRPPNRAVRRNRQARLVPPARTRCGAVLSALGALLLLPASRTLRSRPRPPRSPCPRPRPDAATNRERVAPFSCVAGFVHCSAGATAPCARTPWRCGRRGVEHKRGPVEPMSRRQPIAQR